MASRRGPGLVGETTENGNRVGDITIGGTLGLVIFVGLGTGVFGGIVYAIVEPWLRRVRPWHGLVYGVALLLAFGFTVLDPSNFDFTRFGAPLLNVAMFAALFVNSAWSAPCDPHRCCVARPRSCVGEVFRGRSAMRSSLAH